MDFQSLGGEIAEIKERRKMRGITLNETARRHRKSVKDCRHGDRGNSRVVTAFASDFT